MFRSLLFKIGFLGLIIILAVVSYFYWIEFKKRFPIPQHAHYVGTLKNLDGDLSLIPISLHFDRKTNRIFLNFMSERWTSKTIEPVLLEEGEWFAPLQVQDEKRTLLFTGSSRNGSYLTGQVTEYEKHKESTIKRTGQWKLSPISVSERLYSAEDEASLAHWNERYEQLAKIHMKRDEAERVSPRLTDEIERLTEFLNDRTKLQEEGSKKITEVKKQYEDVRQRRDAVLKELQRVQDTYDLALKVSPEGTLVHLERSIAQLESEWIDAQLESVRSGAGRDFQEQVQRAKEILKLQEQIALERGRTNILLPEKPEEVVQ